MRLMPDDLPSVLDGSTVAVLDPLAADRIYERLPEMNRHADIRAIARAVQSIVPSSLTVEQMGMTEMCAATRDLGILLGSLRRHGAEPIEVVPDVEAPLLQMAARTGMVPRETLFHTSVWNPRGSRQRMFTGDRNEDILLEATRMGAIGVERMLQALVPLVDVPFDAPDFDSSCMAIAEEIGAMVDAVELCRREMDPVFFAQVQRPYYEQIVLGGKKYSGAAAAALSIGVVDHLLWASDCEDADYRLFQNETVQYAKPCWIHVYRQTLGLPSLVTRLRAEVQRDPGRLLTRACTGVSAMLLALLKFRGRHRLLAQSAYDASVRLYAVGSAGFGIDTLEHVLSLTHASNRLMREAHATSGGLSGSSG